MNTASQDPRTGSATPSSELLNAVGQITMASSREDINAIISGWARARGIDAHIISLGAKDERELVVKSTFWNSSLELDSYFSQQIYRCDPLLRCSTEGQGMVSWDIEEIRRDAPEYHRYVRDNTQARNAMCVALPKGDKGLNAASFFSRERFVMNRDLANEAYLLCCAAMCRMGALGQTRSQDQALMRLRSLSDTQSRILEWISVGKTNAEIGIIMGFKTRTIEYHVAEILKKLGVATRVQASVLHAAAHG